MIKVVKNKVKEIAVEDLTDSHFIGVTYAGGKRGAVIKFSAGEYISVTLTGNNAYDVKTGYKSISLLVTHWSIEDCYVFETAKKLFTWVANG